MRLKNWTDEHRKYFNLQRVRGVSIAEGIRGVCRAFPDAFEYGYPTVLAYTQSGQGVSELKAARDEVAANAKEVLLAKSGGRLDMLVELATDLIHEFRCADTVKNKTDLSAEIRSTLREIRQEVDPLGLENEASRSHFEKMLSSFDKLKADDKERILAVSEATWKPQQPVEN